MSEPEIRLIDADKLSNNIYENVPAPYEDSREAKEECLRIIEEALTIDAAPIVHGRWLSSSDRPDINICSVCNYGEDVWWADKGTNYCPNCGAKMDGGEDNE